MTNAVATSDPRAVAAPKEPIQTGGAIAGLIPRSEREMFRLAEALSKSGDMIPKAFQGKPFEIMAAMMRGLEIGLAPMQALASIAVINGRASLWGDALPALVQRAGHHIDVEIEGEGEKMLARATLTRGDSGRQIVRTFSMADAKRAGLLGKQGPWAQYPQRMIAHRARSWAVRDGASDALMGLQVAEETSDYGPDRAKDVTPAAPRRGGAIYREPEPVREVDAIEEHVEAEDVISHPSDDLLARAEAEALAAIEAQDRELGS